MGMYQGVNASEGIGIGTVMVAVDPDLTFEPHEVADSAAEKERYQTALSVFCEKTQAQADHMKETVGEAEAEIMSGHIVLAQDPGMTDAINAAIADVQAGRTGPIPRQLQNKHFDGEDAAVKGQNYKYAHDFENHWVEQQYLPDVLKDVKYYTFGDNRTEQAARAYWAKIKGEDKL